MFGRVGYREAKERRLELHNSENMKEMKIGRETHLRYLLRAHVGELVIGVDVDDTDIVVLQFTVFTLNFKNWCFR